MMMDKSLAIFQGQQVRRAWYSPNRDDSADPKDDWWFSVVAPRAYPEIFLKKIFTWGNVVGVLTESENPRNYWADLKSKLKEEGFEVSDFIVQLKLEAPDGKLRETDCANKQGLFRIIQTIPSKKAEPYFTMNGATGNVEFFLNGEGVVYG